MAIQHGLENDVIRAEFFLPPPGAFGIQGGLNPHDIMDMGEQWPPQELVDEHKEQIDYSDKYADEVFEYRWVTVPRAIQHLFPQTQTLSEKEWRARGIVMSRGWVHYDHHAPEANVLLFRRPLHTDPKTGQAPPEIMKKAKEREDMIRDLENRQREAIAERERRQHQNRSRSRSRRVVR